MSRRLLLLFIAVGLACATVNSPPASAYFSTDSFPGYYIAASNAYYMVTSPVVYQIYPVAGTSPQLYTITQGGYYLSSKLNGNGYNQDGAAASYNQWQFVQVDATHFTIYSAYAQATYGYPWLCPTSTPYGPYAPEMCQSALTWTVQGYFGCYADQGTRDLPFHAYDAYGTTRSTVENCQARCGLSGYQYAGAQDGGQCFCGNSFGSYGVLYDSSCNEVCSGNSNENCGGSWANSVYSAFPSTYIGCFVDTGSRDLPVMVWDESSHRVTIEDCLVSCGSAGYTYAGLQNGDQCFCGNAYGAFGQVSDSQCSVACTNDNTETCGNAWRNQIYKTNKLITSPPSYPHPTYAPTPSPTPAPPSGCAYWDGSAIANGAHLRIYSPTIGKWLNYGNLPIGTNPLGLWFQSTAATFTYNSVSSFSYNGVSGQQGYWTSSAGNVFDSSYSGNFVTVNTGGGDNWYIAIVDAGHPNVNLYASQITASYAMILGLQNMNSQTMLGYLQPNNAFQLFVC